MKQSVHLGMKGLYAIVGSTFVALAALSGTDAGPYLWTPYALGALIAFGALLAKMPVVLARLVAVVASILLFFFFAGFFLKVPELGQGWYRHPESRISFSLLFGAFAMLPVLSHYSCRCKARHDEASAGGMQGFFSAPSDSHNDYS